jgi:hypothetical protein
MNLPDKPTLVLTDDQTLSLSMVKEEIEKYFNVVFYDPSVEYDKRSTLIVINSIRKSDYHWQILNSGLKIVMDSLCEPTHAVKRLYNDITDVFMLTNTNWFWYRESLINFNNDSLKDYVPNKSYKYLALMPMNIDRPHRNQLLEAMHPFLNSFIWSYIGHARYKKQLPDDLALAFGHLEHDRYFNPIWYDETCFSIVAETAVELPEQSMFITEKTFKPIAFRHPFLIFGLPFTLKYLQEQGFETFENLFDESYDSLTDEVLRLAGIKNNVIQYKKIPYDSCTLEKIQHNHRHFFNQDLIKKRLVKEICEPLMNYVNSR